MIREIKESIFWIYNDVCLIDGKRVSILLESKLKLTSVDYDKDASITGGDTILHDITSYQKPVGKLLYSTITRPYISYIMQTLSQFIQSTKKCH